MNILLPKNSSDINGFIHKVKRLKVTCEQSSTIDGAVCNNAIDPLEDYYFCSNNSANQWMNISFPRNRILLTHYSYQSPIYSAEWRKGPKSWVFRGLNEKKEWVDLDVVDNEAPKISNGIITRNINKSSLFSAFSLQMYGTNYYEENNLRINKIDFFGSISPPFGYYKSCICKKYQISRLICLCMNIIS